MEFEKYKKGQLSEEELDQFTEKLVKAKFRQEQKERWAKKLATEQGLIRNPTKKNKPYVLSIRKLAIAASILLLIALLPFLPQYFQPEYQQVADGFLENPISLDGDTRGGTLSQQASESILKADNFYKNGKYQKAAAIYEVILKTPAAKPENYLFAGASYLYIGQFNKAVEKLNLASKKIEVDKLYWEEANWLLALAYVKQKNLEEAKTLLNAIISSNLDYSKPAQELLDTIQLKTKE